MPRVDVEVTIEAVSGTTWGTTAPLFSNTPGAALPWPTSGHIEKVVVREDASLAEMTAGTVYVALGNAALVAAPTAEKLIAPAISLSSFGTGAASSTTVLDPARPFQCTGTSDAKLVPQVTVAGTVGGGTGATTKLYITVWYV